MRSYAPDHLLGLAAVRDLVVLGGLEVVTVDLDRLPVPAEHPRLPLFRDEGGALLDESGRRRAPSIEGLEQDGGQAGGDREQPVSRVLQVLPESSISSVRFHQT